MTGLAQHVNALSNRRNHDLHLPSEQLQIMVHKAFTPKLTNAAVRIREVHAQLLAGRGGEGASRVWVSVEVAGMQQASYQ